VAVVSFMAGNKPDAVSPLFNHVMEDLKVSQVSSPEAKGKDLLPERLHLARRFREAMFTGGLLCGYSRAISGLIALSDVMPDELKEKKHLRDTSLSLDAFSDKGRRLFRSMYGSNASNVQQLLDSVYPDLGWFSNTVGYGLMYGGAGILSQVETSYVLATANIVMDTPKQATWHMATAQNGGASFEEVKAVREIAIQVGTTCGIKWENEIPEVERVNC